MIHVHKGMLMGAVVLLGAGLFIPCRVMAQVAQSQECVFLTVNGTVAKHDWVGSVLIVSIGADDLFLVVDRKTVFKKGASEISFMDINQGDPVSVKYYDCGFAGLKAVTVTVTSGY